MIMYKDPETLEQGMEELKKFVGIRNQMGGAMYWNMLNDQCCELANKLTALGGDNTEIAKLLGDGNFQYNK